jgi:hypothetical protein
MGNGYGTKVLSCPTPQPPSATAARVAGNPVAMESVAEGWTPSPMALSCTSSSGRVAPERHVDRDLQVKSYKKQFKSHTSPKKSLLMIATHQPVRLAYQPPASSTFLSQQISHQQPANSTFLSEQTSTSHQPPAKRTGRMFLATG